MEKKRILWMDISKAIGILIVLVVHAEIHLGPVTFLGGMFYMPVFFILAGMTFREEPLEPFGVFVKKKVQRLLLPYLGYNLFLFLFFLAKDLLRGTYSSGTSFFPLLGILYSRNCLYPMGTEQNVYFMQILNAPTWFLTCLFLTLVLFWFLQRVSQGRKDWLLWGNGILLVLAILLHYTCPILLPWSLDCALYAVAFLTVGKLAAKEQWVEKIYQNPLRLLALVLVFAGCSYLNGSVNMSVAEYGHSMLLYLLIGISGSLLCMVFSAFVERHFPRTAKVFACLGRHTLPVLCLHLFVYALVGSVLGVLF